MSVAALVTPEPRTAVRIGADHITITDFIETDPDVVAVISAAADPDAATHRLLRLGANAVTLTTATVDAQILSDTVADLADRVDSTVRNAIAEIGSTTGALLDEKHGNLPVALRQFTSELDGLLGKEFDPDSKASIIGKIENVVHGAVTAQVIRMERMLDPGIADSHISRVTDALVRSVRAETSAVAVQIRELEERLAAQRAAEATVKVVAEKTTAKGFAFEDVLHSYLEPLAAAQHDLAEQTGHVYGLSANRRGDEVITLNADDTRGVAARFVIEAKNQRMSKPKIFEELAQALDNRGATVGIAVFADPGQAPTTVPFTDYGNKAILQLDGADPDPHLIRFAYIWARWMTRRTLTDTTDEIDLARIDDLIRTARDAMSRTSQIRGLHTKSRNAIDEATTLLNALDSSVKNVLDQLESEIRTDDFGSGGSPR